MARRLVWSPEAADDLEDITAFDSQDLPLEQALSGDPDYERGHIRYPQVCPGT